MRHRVAGRHLSRTSSHHEALRRNLAQSLFQYGQVETTLIKAKDVRPFVERLITLARKGTLQSRQRVIALLGDRSILSKDEQEKYDAMTDAQRLKVMRSRSGRRHRAGRVPASYNKKKIPFVARSVVQRLIEDVAPKYKGRPGGYTRIIRLSKRRVGDAGDLAILQLVGEEGEAPEGVKKTTSPRRQKARDRIRFLEGKAPARKGRGRQKAPAGAKADTAAAGKPEGAKQDSEAEPST